MQSENETAARAYSRHLGEVLLLTAIPPHPADAGPVGKQLRPWGRRKFAQFHAPTSRLALGEALKLIMRADARKSKGLPGAFVLLLDGETWD